MNFLFMGTSVTLPIHVLKCVKNKDILADGENFILYIFHITINILFIA